MGLPSKNDLAGATATKSQVRNAMGQMWEYLAGVLGSQTPTAPLSDSEKQIARDSLGVGQNGFKNRFINPEFAVRQNPASPDVTAGAGDTYLSQDQWYARMDTGNVGLSTVVGLGDRLRSLQIRTVTVGNTGFVIGQRIEASHTADLKNKNCTVSFNCLAPSTRPFTWSVFSASSQNNFATKSLVASGFVTCNSTFGQVSFTFDAGPNAVNGLAVEISVGTMLASEIIILDSMQLEKSNVATEFQSRPIQQELALCQRYFWVFGYEAVNSIRSTGVTAIAVDGFHYSLSFPVPMINVPTVTIDAMTLVNTNQPTVQSVSRQNVVFNNTTIATGRFSFSNGTLGTGIIANARL